MVDRSQKPVFPAEASLPKADLWPGWVFENGVIHDDAGNKFTKRDIQLSWDAGKIIDGHYGTPSNIANLKDDLKRRKRLSVLPKIVLCYESPEGVEELVFDLKKVVDSA